MSWFTNLEKSIAGKLTKVFTKAKDLAEDAVSDVAKAEAALVAAKVKAAEATKAAHDAALAAVEKAKAETVKLSIFRRFADDTMTSLTSLSLPESVLTVNDHVGSDADSNDDGDAEPSCNSFGKEATAPNTACFS